MSWAYGELGDGTPIGYSVRDTCHHPGCEKKIDRGLAYVCGGMHEGGEHGCGGYFCYEHLVMGGPAQLCGPCWELWEEARRRIDEIHEAISLWKKNDH